MAETLCYSNPVAFRCGTSIPISLELLQEAGFWFRHCGTTMNILLPAVAMMTAATMNWLISNFYNNQNSYQGPRSRACLGPGLVIVISGYTTCAAVGWCVSIGIGAGEVARSC